MKDHASLNMIIRAVSGLLVMKLASSTYDAVILWRRLGIKYQNVITLRLRSIMAVMLSFSDLLEHSAKMHILRPPAVLRNAVYPGYHPTTVTAIGASWLCAGGVFLHYSIHKGRALPGYGVQTHQLFGIFQ
ncbi:Protein of unknown function [Pyronema omphalodes CBS 100304]|uniref:Uncharacterized protein n=1 Tax=Pyronema omphalodes (strain CBS 100304) TaxID=1076935 RepID=U4LUZ8_PYROM|nr:Protein of unknown function [Pyronema omphalodes CBS 100304]